MRPGQKIQIQLIDDSGRPVPIANVLPEVRLFYRGRTERHRYAFKTWATDSEGRCEIRYEDLEDLRHLLGSADLMDFNTPLTECGPLVEVRIPSEDEFQEMKRGPWRRSWWRPAWLTDWPANGQLEPVEPRRVKLEGRVTRVEIPVRLRARQPGSASASQ